MSNFFLIFRIIRRNMQDSIFDKNKPEFSYAASLQPNPSAVLKTPVTTSHLTVKPVIV